MEFDASLLVIMVIFLIAHFIARAFFFRPILDVMKRREGRVEAAKQTYDQAFAEAEERLARERERLQGARKEAAEHRESLRREAQEQRQEMLAAAKEKADGDLAAAREELADQVAGERADLESRARDLADEMAERLLGRAV